MGPFIHPASQPSIHPTIHPSIHFSIHNLLTNIPWHFQEYAGVQRQLHPLRPYLTKTNAKAECVQTGRRKEDKNWQANKEVEDDVWKLVTIIGRLSINGQLYGLIS